MSTPNPGLPEEVDVNDERPIERGDWYRQRVTLTLVCVVHVNGDGVQVQIQRHDNGRLWWTTAAVLRARYRPAAAPAAPTPPPESSAPAPTPAPDTPVDPRASETAHGAVGGVDLTEAEATFWAAISAQDVMVHYGLDAADVEYAPSHDDVRVGLAALTGRNAAEVEAARMDGWNKGVRRGQDGHPAAEQRGREQALRPLVEMHSPRTDRFGKIVCRSCVAGYYPPTGELVFCAYPCGTRAVIDDAVRGATPTPAGGEAGDNLHAALASIRSTMAFNSRDWSVDKADAWLYGIALGWDDDAMDEVAADHGWDPASVDRLRAMNAAFESVTEGAARPSARPPLRYGQPTPDQPFVVPAPVPPAGEVAQAEGELARIARKITASRLRADAGQHDVPPAPTSGEGETRGV